MKKMMIVLTLLSLVGSSAAFAAGNSITLSCDDNNIFEAPLLIQIRGTTASAHGSFSGPGDAIFDISYRALDVIRQGNEITVTQPHVVEKPNGFQLDLRETAVGRYSGRLDVTSTDSDKMPYTGSVDCIVK